ncbi:siroheme decarboxylase subunit beta [Desulfovibrio litoralis]|uniref:siroheme decarboxylase n=1 Tax=Desulfovibrio litoralis DSM 11393 TaxID=1121455 RepID=A0A1M7SB60_9BACT|nr:siroheme decarboxylase subunit beta [Desulfovibrio litoralis]SHN55695.1 transcriptional regulator, AsnC family [Desulfovibrio litoralis DSM 11393]
MSYEFTAIERRILAIVQKNIPESLTPYLDIANEVGCSEAEVLELLQKLKNDGAIRRFGASIKHQKTGYTHNAMVAWKIDETLISEAGKQAAKHPMISHCYFRPSDAEDWPYTLYTMIHGKEEGDCLKVIQELQATTALKEYAMLDSIKELKKTSMLYFENN